MLIRDSGTLHMMLNWLGFCLSRLLQKPLGHALVTYCRSITRLDSSMMS